MNPSKQHQHQHHEEEEYTAAWDASCAYTKHATTPTAPAVSGHDHMTPTKHTASVPFAVAVESSVFSQHAPVSGASGAAGSAPAAMTTAPPSCRSKTQSCLTWLPTLLLFHMCNFALGVTAFAVVVTLVPLSVGLLPLCCIGVVVFRMTALATEWLATIDVALANLVASDDSVKLRVHPRMGNNASRCCSGDRVRNDHNGGSTAVTKDMLIRLVLVSPRNIGAMVYFATLKFVVGILSVIAVGATAVCPVCAIVLAVYSDYELYGFTFDDHPEAYVLSAVGTTLVGLLLLPAVALLSRKLSQFVCADDSVPPQPAAAVVAGTLV